MPLPTSLPTLLFPPNNSVSLSSSSCTKTHTQTLTVSSLPLSWPTISVRDAVCECETGGTLHSQTLAGTWDTAEQQVAHQWTLDGLKIIQQALTCTITQIWCSIINEHKWCCPIGKAVEMNESRGSPPEGTCNEK